VSAPASYTATFQTQYQLTISVYPTSGGAVNAPSSAYYSAGTAVTLAATSNSPFVFDAWSGGVEGGTNPASIAVNAPASVTAVFDVPGHTCTMTGDSAPSIADVQFIVNEALGVMPANNDLNGDGAVNIADVQKTIAAALKSGCL
jgi:hypothetical protein